MQQHDLIIFCGPMFSEKTSKLLSYADRCKYQNRKVICFKPKIDNRYSVQEIVTHSGTKYPAIMVESGYDMLKILSDSQENYDTICVDEMFMIKGSADSLIWLFKKGFNIVVSTLDLSSRCLPFPEIEKLLPYATKIEKCAAVCTVCGKDARYSYRKISDDNDIFVGGSETYEPRCYDHHPLVKEEI